MRKTASDVWGIKHSDVWEVSNIESFGVSNIQMFGEYQAFRRLGGIKHSDVWGVNCQAFRPWGIKHSDICPFRHLKTRHVDGWCF